MSQAGLSFSIPRHYTILEILLFCDVVFLTFWGGIVLSLDREQGDANACVTRSLIKRLARHASSRQRLVGQEATRLRGLGPALVAISLVGDVGIDFNPTASSRFT